MGLIKEPEGVDLVVGPAILTERDRKLISRIIADYKQTGKIPVKGPSARRTKPSGKKIADGLIKVS